MVSAKLRAGIAVRLPRPSPAKGLAAHPRLSMKTRPTALPIPTRDVQTRRYVQFRDSNWPRKQWRNPIERHAQVQGLPSKRYYSLHHRKKESSNHTHRATWITSLLLSTTAVVLVTVSQPEVTSLDTTLDTTSSFRIASVSYLSAKTAILYIQPTSDDKEIALNWGKQFEMVALILSPSKVMPAWPLPPESPNDTVLRVAISDEDGPLPLQDLVEGSLVSGSKVAVDRPLRWVDLLRRSPSLQPSQDPVAASRCKRVVHLSSAAHPFGVIQLVHQHFSDSKNQINWTSDVENPKTFQIIWIGNILEDASAEDSLPSEIQNEMKESGMLDSRLRWLNHPKNRIIYSALQSLQKAFPDRVSRALLVHEDVERMIEAFGWILKGVLEHQGSFQDKDESTATPMRLPDVIHVFGPHEIHKAVECPCAISGQPVALTSLDHLCRWPKTTLEDTVAED